MSGPPLFLDRLQAGQELGRELVRLGLDDPVVVALPRGGVPVGYEVARTLNAPLDIGLVRKLGVPGHEELGFGAIGEHGEVVADQQAVSGLGITATQFASLLDRERSELDRRRAVYREHHAPVSVRGRVVVVVDDGVATGVTAAAALEVLRARGARSVILAVPVASPRTTFDLEVMFDRIVCLHAPRGFRAVGEAYADFSQVSDREVLELLARSRRPRPGPSGPPQREDVMLPTREGPQLPGILVRPHGARGVVLFAHGSGSSRNVRIAERLNEAGFATLLLDLLHESEAADRRRVFDIGLLSRRLIDATGWVAGESAAAGLPVGYFGASTGAAATLVAAAELGPPVRAIVSRGGRPDLAQPYLERVRAPTLLIVGGHDWDVIRLNEQAVDSLGGRSQLEIVEGAGHLFEEPGALPEVSRLAACWFTGHLGEVRDQSPPMQVSA